MELRDVDQQHISFAPSRRQEEMNGDGMATMNEKHRETLTCEEEKKRERRETYEGNMRALKAMTSGSLKHIPRVTKLAEKPSS